ncbi:hypothetical protein IFR05_007993 [Cadophora sp. M221]|nr:hypothetical protein IFR05_007993 [Cadophora sp. M221]
MVAISRVFDFEGLWEVIGEVDHISPASSEHELRGESEKEKGVFGDSDEIEMVVEQDICDDEPEPEILDSEEDLTPPASTPPAISKDQEEEASEDEGMEIIIVDNMTHIINELFSRKEKSDGKSPFLPILLLPSHFHFLSNPEPQGTEEHTNHKGEMIGLVNLKLRTLEISTNHPHPYTAHNLLTLLSKTLHTLTKTQNILTILHNTTNSSTTTTYPPNPNRQTQNQHAQSFQGKIAQSIFASSAQKPALGQIFAQFPDIHLFMHSLPRGKRDAEVLYAGGVASGEDIFGEGDNNSEGGVKYVTVIEVLKDEAAILGEDTALERKRFGYREQRWTAVDVDVNGGGGGMGLVCAFGERGGMKGMGLSREGGLSGGVGNVAKIWGFGGRRV